MTLRVQDMLPDVRQSAFALVGDLARACPAYLSPVLTQLVALSLANLETSAISHATVSACNNACWSLGAPGTLTGSQAVSWTLDRKPYNLNPKFTGLALHLSVRQDPVHISDPNPTKEARRVLDPSAPGSYFRAHSLLCAVCTVTCVLIRAFKVY